MTDYARVKASLASQWGFQPEPSDIFWTVANEQILKLGSQLKWHELGMVYRVMAKTLDEESKPFNHLLKEAANAEVRNYESKASTPYGGFFLGVSILSNGCCENCQQLHGRRYTFEEALTDEPLPNLTCTRGWCNCSWNPWLNRP